MKTDVPSQNSEKDNNIENIENENRDRNRNRLSIFSASVSSNYAINISRKESYQEKSHSSVDVCRICFESGQKDKIIIPCQCEGSIKYVHKKCIERWILSSGVPIDDAKCEICKSKFQIRRIKPTELSKAQKKKLIITCFLFIILVGSIIVGCIFGLYFGLRSRRIIQTKQNQVIYFSLVGVLSVIIIFLLSFLLVKCYKYKLLSELEETWEVIDLKDNLEQNKGLQEENIADKDLILRVIPVNRRKITSISPETMTEIISSTQVRMKKTLN
jgi:hypothetical protein